MEQLELDSIHDFASKLTLPGSREALEHYIRWQVAQRTAKDTDATELDPSRVPDFAPISINLDLTTACNYACDHCVDLDILNTGIRFDHDKLLSSLQLMAERGIASRATFVIDKQGNIQHIEEGKEAVDPTGALSACRRVKR